MSEVEVTAPVAGARIGRFVIVRPLGSGGMSTVYEARDPELTRSVALKLIRERDPQLTMRLLREAQVLAQFQHPNVVAVHELDLHEEQAFIAMELVDGETLDKHLERTRPDWRAIVSLFLQVGRGLAAAHEKGIVHRDIKPSNLFVDATGRVRVGDFGLARLVGDDLTVEGGTPRPPRGGAAEVTTDDSDAVGEAPGQIQPVRSTGQDVLRSPLTRVGAVMGTPYFMAPEQHRGRRATAATDQFSFCVTLWLALFGEHPFVIEDDIAEAVIVGRRRDSKSSKKIPRWLVKLLDRGLAVDPAARHPSMEVLVAQLARAQRRRRWPLFVAAGVVLVGATIAVVLATRRPPADLTTTMTIRHATSPLFVVGAALAKPDTTIAGAALIDAFSASDDPNLLLDAMRLYFEAGRCESALRAAQTYTTAMNGRPLPPDEIRLELIRVHRDCSVRYMATDDLEELDRLSSRYYGRDDLPQAIKTLQRMRTLSKDPAQRARYMLRIGDFSSSYGLCRAAKLAYEVYLKELPAENTDPEEPGRVQRMIAACKPAEDQAP